MKCGEGWNELWADGKIIRQLLCRRCTPPTGVPALLACGYTALLPVLLRGKCAPRRAELSGRPGADGNGPGSPTYLGHSDVKLCCQLLPRRLDARRKLDGAREHQPAAGWEVMPVGAARGGASSCANRLCPQIRGSLLAGIGEAHYLDFCTVVSSHGVRVLRQTGERAATTEPTPSLLGFPGSPHGCHKVLGVHLDVDKHIHAGQGGDVHGDQTGVAVVHLRGAVGGGGGLAGAPHLGKLDGGEEGASRVVAGRAAQQEEPQQRAACALKKTWPGGPRLCTQWLHPTAAAREGSTLQHSTLARKSAPRAAAE